MTKDAVPSMDAIPPEEPYRRKIGKVTFVVSSFGNPKSTETARQMILRMLEEQVRRGNDSMTRDCA